MPWISFDTKKRHFPWKKVSWKVYARLMKEYFGRIKRKPKPKPAPAPTPTPTPTPTPSPKPPAPIEMYDDVNVSLIPVNAVAVAGYVDGKWPTYKELVKKFPKSKYRLSIAVFARDDANVLDVEPGDATIAEAPAWVKREHAKGNPTPILYTSAAYGQKLVDTMTKAGFKYGKDYRWWSAHYTFKPHLCSSKCGFGIKVVAHATQWTDKAGGKSLDESICSEHFFPGT